MSDKGINDLIAGFGAGVIFAMMVVKSLRKEDPYKWADLIPITGGLMLVMYAYCMVAKV